MQSASSGSASVSLTTSRSACSSSATARRSRARGSVPRSQAGTAAHDRRHWHWSWHSSVSPGGQPSTCVARAARSARRDHDLVLAVGRDHDQRDTGRASDDRPRSARGPRQLTQQGPAPVRGGVGGNRPARPICTGARRQAASAWFAPPATGIAREHRARDRSCPVAAAVGRAPRCRGSPSRRPGIRGVMPAPSAPAAASAARTPRQPSARVAQRTFIARPAIGRDSTAVPRASAANRSRRRGTRAAARTVPAPATGGDRRRSVQRRAPARSRRSIRAPPKTQQVRGRAAPGEPRARICRSVPACRAHLRVVSSPSATSGNAGATDDGRGMGLA